MSEKTVNLFDLGCLVQINIGFWSGRKMLTQNDMLSVGIDSSKLPKDICNLGRKLLVPQHEIGVFLSIEQQARNFLKRWSIPFGIASANFVPISKLQEVVEKLDEYKAKYYGLVDSFIKRFEAAKSKIQIEHPDFWEKCLRPHYPSSAESLRSRFYFRYFVFKVANVNAIDEVDANDVVAKQTEMQVRMKEEVDKLVNETVCTLRNETVKFCDLVVARVNGSPYGDEEEGKKLTKRSLASFRKYVDWFREMNVFGDKDIEKMLCEFKSTYLGELTTPQEIQNTQVANAIVDHMSKIRSMAQGDSGAVDNVLNIAKRKIEI